MSGIHTFKMKKMNFLFWLVVPLFYLAGAIGMQTGFRDTFIGLSPFLLVISSSLLFFSNSENQAGFTWFTLTCLVLGFGIEVAGVKSGIIFGEYVYGSALGPKIFDTPVVIGFNWFLISVSCGAIAELFFTKRYLIIISAAFLAVVLDILIEPVAIFLGYWSWEGGKPGILNYLGWFLFSLFLQSIAAYFGIRLKSNAAIVLFFSNLIFFIILNFAG